MEGATAEAIPECLQAVAKGGEASFDRQEIYDLNAPNYPLVDILVNNLSIQMSPYDEKIKGNIAIIEGHCDFPKNSNIPACAWDHVPGSLLMDVINQAGKASQSFFTSFNGIALAYTDMKIKRPAPPKNISFRFMAKLYAKRRHLWVDAEWEFFHEGESFAKSNTRSVGMLREYSYDAR